MDIMQKARARLLFANKFFATLVLSLPMEEDNSVPTAYTDMKMIGYNKSFVESLPIQVVIFVIAHEACHVMLKHGLRRRGRDPRLWNIACDYAINFMLKEAGFTLWEHCCYDVKFAGMSAEQIYEIIVKEEPADGPNGDEDGGSKGGKPGKGRGGHQPVNERGRPCDGGMPNDVREPEELGDKAAEAKIVQGIDQKIAQAATMGRMAGQMTASLDRLVQGLLNPPLPWYQLARDYMHRIVHDEETWARRNRRIGHMYLPTRWNEAMGEIIFIGDTSGSMPDGVFPQIGAEIVEFVEVACPERVRVIWADDDACSREEVFEPGDPVVLHPKGNGGTDMRKPLKYVEQFDPRLVILVTDGDTPWPDYETPYPLIICCTDEIEKCPAWSQNVHIDIVGGF